jgi:hypothetical protein
VFGGCYVASTLPLNYFTQDDMGEAQVNEAADRHAARRDGPDPARDGGGRRRASLRARWSFATRATSASTQPLAKLDVLLLPKDERTSDRHDLRGAARRILARVSGVESVTVSHPEYASSGGEGHSEIMYGIEGPEPRAPRLYCAADRGAA